MKVFISADIEGIACVVAREDGKLEGVEYERAREWMTGEVNAAIEGAFEAGAKEVVVADSHGHMRNILADKLHEDALLVRGSPRPGTMVEGMDETFDAAIFIGYHSRAGNPKGVLAHTYLGSTIYEVRLNGMAVGEPGLNAAIVGHYGVPVALIAGDDTVKEEVNEIMPWTENVVTKWAISTLSAKNLTPKASQKKIKAGVVAALGRLDGMKPFVVEKPVKLELDLMQALSAHIASDIPGVKRMDGRRIEYIGDDMLDVLRIVRLVGNSVLGNFFI
ncbi:MAG: M55 family metallopeptidase [Anaerolineaceae bacterium]|nr:M55 family metallopeptidase [Anaerolineaceae bacterium]